MIFLNVKGTKGSASLTPFNPSFIWFREAKLLLPLLKIKDLIKK